jgi:hypothetical protein
VGVDQIALPLRIALAALLVVAALWFTVLKPKPADTASTAPPPQAPGMAGLNRAIDKAKGAVTTSAAANAAAGADSTVAGSATPASTAATATTAATRAAQVRAAAKAKAKAANGVAAGDPSGPLLNALDQGKVVVLLFWNSNGADDRAARDAVRGAGRHGGQVVVKVAPIKQVGSYAAITTGVKVNESPTVLVIDPSHQARPIVGYTTASEVDQAIGDALRNSTGVRRAASLQRDAAVLAKRLCGADGACRDYLAQANAACATISAGNVQAALQAGASAADFSTALTAVSASTSKGVAAFTALKPPAARAAAHAEAAAILKAQVGVLNGIVTKVRTSADPPGAFLVATRQVNASAKVKTQNRTLKSLGYTTCAA